MRFHLSLVWILCLGLALLSCSTDDAVQQKDISPPSDDPRIIGGVVSDNAGNPLSGATVRVQTTLNEIKTDSNGYFTLDITDEKSPITISAWKEGYYCGKVEGVSPSSGTFTITLIKYQSNDNPAYVWVPPVGEGSCYSCKPAVTDVWLKNDAHAGSAENPRFLSMYNGADLDGNQSPAVRFGYIRDYGSFPLPPDTSQPNYGPGYKLDFPQSAGNCAACHVPGSAVNSPYGIDPNTITGTDKFGVHCDFCHKVADVKLDPETGLPYPNMPGVLSMDIRRPFPDDPERYQLFFGTFDDDNVPEEDTYLPLIERSEFCSSCHFGVFWDVVIYNSFGEWLESPYSDPHSGQTCQDCHMPSPTISNGKSITNVAEGKGGVKRDPSTIHAHTFPGAMNQELLQDAVDMQVDTKRDEDNVFVTITITNDNTGHHIPTDYPLRNMILLIQAFDSDGEKLIFVEGPVVPDWGGIGNPEDGYYAGLPGRGYARVLQEIWTGVSPTGAYWNPTREISDTRLAANAVDTSSYAFATPKDGPVSVSTTLLFRRAFIEIMDQKSWETPDIVMQMVTIHIP